MHRQVGLVGAVHAEHAEPLRIGGGVGAEPHQRRSDGKPGELHQLAQEMARLRSGIDDAAAGVKQRPLGTPHQLDRGLDAVEVALDLRLVALVLEVPRPGIRAFGELEVLGNVDHHRTRPAALGDMERLVQHARKLADVLDEVIVLGAGPRDADRVAFLEGIVADQMGRHLPGDAHDRDRIHERIGQAGDCIGGAGAGGHQHAADLAGRAGIAFGGMHGALLVPHQDVPDLLLLEQRVIDRQHRAARIAEQVLDPLIGQCLDHHLGAGQLFVHGQLHSLLALFPIKKGPQGPCSAHRQFADGLSHPRRCAFLRYPQLSNKIAHSGRSSLFPCEVLIIVLGIARQEPTVELLSVTHAWSER